MMHYLVGDVVWRHYVADDPETALREYVTEWAEQVLFETGEFATVPRFTWTRLETDWDPDDVAVVRTDESTAIELDWSACRPIAGETVWFRLAMVPDA